MSRYSTLIVSAAAVCLSATAFVPSVAAARTFERCDADGDHCVRVHCDSDGDRCWKQSRYGKDERYSREGRWVCDHDGDRCHYVYTGGEWHPHHWEHEEH